MDNLSQVFVKIDNVCDYVPVLSTVSNSVDIFAKIFTKYVVLPLANDATKASIKKDMYYRHIKYKDWTRSLVLLLPFGINNLIVGIYDFYNRKYHTKEGLLDNLRNARKFDVPIIMEKASKELRDDPEIMIEAVKKNGAALKYASKRLRDDYDVVKAAVTSTSEALQYAGPKQCDCEEIVRITAQGNLFGFFALVYGSDRFKDNEEIALIALRYGADAGQGLSPNLQNNPIFMEKLVGLCPFWYDFAPEEMKQLPSFKRLYKEKVKPYEDLQEEVSRLFARGFRRFCQSEFPFVGANLKSSQNDLKLQKELKNLIEELEKERASIDGSLPLGKIALRIVDGDRSARSVLEFEKDEEITLESLKQRKKDIIRDYHPDKNINNVELAHRVFLCCQKSLEILSAEIS